MATPEQGGSGHRRVKAAAQRGLTTAQTTPWFRTVGVTAWLILGVAGVLALALLLTALVAEVAIPLADRRRAGGAAGAAHGPPRALAGSQVARAPPSC